MANKINLSPDRRDVINDYDATDSENEYTEREKNILKKVRKRRQRGDDHDNKKELFAFAEKDSSDDDEKLNENEDSDIEDNADYDIPDARAWGNKRGAYYNTDFIDQDYSNYNPQEEEEALQEEEEAKAIQQRLAQELNEVDFTLDLFSSETVATKSQENEINCGKRSTGTTTKLKADLTDLSQRQKLQLFEKESPEFTALARDFEQNIKDSDELLQPLVDYAKLKQISFPFFQFIEMKNKISLNYITNIAFYLLLKANNVSVKNHPIIKRLFQMRQLQVQLNEKFEQIIKPQILDLLEQLREGEDIICSMGETKIKSLGSEREKMDYDNNAVDDDNLNSDADNDDEQERRAINYQISKNKGLMPHRKKELRNPRVKHRNKFRKALIRRKGAVRSVRTEEKRYGGELSGIKATGKKGIKIR